MNNFFEILKKFGAKASNLIQKYGLLLLLIFIILAGAFLRIRLVFSNQSFWFDECALITNLVTKNYVDFIKPLDFGQVAPPLFLVIEKLMFEAFHKIFPIEMTFRFFPCFCSILSLILLPIFVDKVYKNRLFTCGVACFSAFAPYVVNYSNEVKQYSCELLVSILLISFFYFFDVKFFSKKKLFLFSLLLGLSPWISLSSLFVIAIGSLLVLFNINQHYKSYEKIKYMTLYLFPICAGFLVYWFFYAKSIQKYQYDFMLEYWQIINPSMFNHLNFYQMFSEKTEYFLSNFCGIDYTHWHIFFWCNVALLLLIRNKKMNFFLLGTLILTVCAGFMKIYPYEPRLILFLFPVFAMIYMQFLLFLKNRVFTVLIAITLFVVTINSLCLSLSEYVVHKSEIRNIFEKLKEINPTLKNVIAPKSCYVCYGGHELLYDLDVWKNFEKDEFEQSLKIFSQDNYFIYLPYRRFNSSFNREFRDFLFSSELFEVTEFYSFGDEDKVFVAKIQRRK